MFWNLFSTIPRKLQGYAERDEMDGHTCTTYISPTVYNVFLPVCTMYFSHCVQYISPIVYNVFLSLCTMYFSRRDLNRVTF